jgi:hypothetical protein
VDSLDEPAMEALAALKLPSLRHFDVKATDQDDWLEHLVGAPWVSRLQSLAVDSFCSARGPWAGVEMPCLQLLCLLGSGAWPDAATAASLAALALPELQALVAHWLGARDVRALSRAAWWPSLQCLVVAVDAECDGGLAAVRALVCRPPPRLRVLRIYSKPLCADALRLLAAAQLPLLEEFALGVRRVGEEEKSGSIDAARAILEAATWRRQCNVFKFI